jgi:hypothetical protein
MTPNIDRRLRAVEGSRFGSERVAAILRRVDTLSDRELREQVLGSAPELFDSRFLTDAEIAALMAEFEARGADS